MHRKYVEVKEEEKQEAGAKIEISIRTQNGQCVNKLSHSNYWFKFTISWKHKNLTATKNIKYSH